MRIAFVWNGDGDYDLLSNDRLVKDGLGLALVHLEERGHTVGYFKTKDRMGIDAFMPDVLLYWGTLIQPDKNIVASYPYKKAIAFAGAQIEAGNVDGFDMYFVESEINEFEFYLYHKPCMRAFGINEEVFTPKETGKKYDAFCAAMFAAWKRPELFAKTFGNKGAWAGLFQPHERWCYEVCIKAGVDTFNLLPRTELAMMMNQSHVVVNCASEWGGGQRLTLEAMACNIPVIVMDDSRKNKEFVDEAGQGFICSPDSATILRAYEMSLSMKYTTRDYVMSKWTSVHYADALEKGLKQIV